MRRRIFRPIQGAERPRIGEFKIRMTINPTSQGSRHGEHHFGVQGKSPLFPEINQIG